MPNLQPAREALDAAHTALAEWHERAAGYVTAGHDAVKHIDATLRALHEARAALIAEIRTDRDDRAARVDALLADEATR